LPTNTPTLEPTAEWPTPFSLGEAGTSFGASGELTQRYESDSYPFALQVPADWVSSEQDKALATSFCQGAEICYGSILGDVLIFSVEDLAQDAPCAEDASDCADAFIAASKETADVDGFKLLSRKPFITEQGLEGVVVEFELASGLVAQRAFIVYKGFFLQLSYAALSGRELYDLRQPLIQRILSTIEVIDQ
jgi:hypothetical protein